MQSTRAAVNDLFDELRETGARRPLLGEAIDLLLCRDLASDEEPEEALGQWFLATGSLGEFCLDIRDGVIAETNALDYNARLERARNVG